MPMRPPPAPLRVIDLADLDDSQLFDALAEGLQRIHDHVASLEASRNACADAGETRGARVLSLLLEEEAAKYLILLDAARCPRERLREHLRKFGSHVARAIYANMCEWHPTAQGFRELLGYIELELPNYYLDGPNDVDWLLPNSLKADREQALYVDYVRTDEGHRWVSPLDSDRFVGRLSSRLSTAVVELVKALHKAGIGRPAALVVVADLWRAVDVESETDIHRLWERTSSLLDALAERGLLADGSARRFIVDRWLYPLWSLSLELRKVKVEDLRRQQEAWVPPDDYY